jgi:hypothetical protein
MICCNPWAWFVNLSITPRPNLIYNFGFSGANRRPHLSSFGPERACKIRPSEGLVDSRPSLGPPKLGRRTSPDAAVQSARAFAVNGEALRPHLSSSRRLGSLLL